MKTTELQRLPNQGCCKYPIGKGKDGMFKWCAESAVKGGYCKFHYSKCYTGKNKDSPKPMELDTRIWR